VWRNLNVKLHIADSRIVRDNLFGAGASPAEILGIEVAFHCTKCDAELTGDFRLQGRLIDCPQCGRMIEVPLWAAAEILVALNLARQQTSETRLSAEELAFLSSGGLRA
jgi:hypothetical protein